MDFINLINHQNNWYFSRFQALDNHVIALATRLISWHHEEDGIHLTQGAIGRFNHKIT